MKTETRLIPLSPPHPAGSEALYVEAALDGNGFAPTGPQLDAFEREFARTLGIGHAVGLSSGTSALHLALRLLGVGPDDDVLLPTLTCVGSAAPVVFRGARPVFVDAEAEFWNVDPDLLAEEIEDRASRGRPPKAVIAVHLFGQCAALSSIVAACAQHSIPLIEDAGQALGASYSGRSVGTLGRIGIFSLDGDKTITASGGAMLVTDDASLADRAHRLAVHGLDSAPDSEHRELGYDCGLSNIQAAIGRAQLSVLESRVAARRRNARWYQASLDDLPGLKIQAEAPWGRHARWLTCLTVDPAEAGLDRDELRRALARERIEARPLWKPLHLQPVFRGMETARGDIAEVLSTKGLCLPSGSSLDVDDLDRVTSTIRRAFELAAPYRLTPVRWSPALGEVETDRDPATPLLEGVL